MAATVCFLLLAALVLYGCVLLVTNVVKKEFIGRTRPENRTLAAVTSTPVPTPENVLSAVKVQAPSPAVSMEPSFSPAPSPALTAAPAPLPSETLRPIAEPKGFSAGNMDFFLTALDEAHGADWITLVSVRENECRVIGVPRNALSVGGTPLMEETSPRVLLSKLPGVFPVRYRYYVSVAPQGLKTFIELFGNISVQGRSMNLAEVEAYLAGGGKDELLRMERQQQVLQGCVEKLREVGWLQLLRSKSALQGAIRTNLTVAQLVELYAQLRRTDASSITYSALPVDSVTVGEQRYYQCDPVRVNAIAAQLFD